MQSGGDWAAHWNHNLYGVNDGTYTSLGSTFYLESESVTQQNCLAAAVSMFGDTVVRSRNSLVVDSNGGGCVVRDSTLSPARVG